MKVLVTGSNGLIGSEAVLYYDQRGHEVVGIDNNMRAVFFGFGGDTLWNLARLRKATTRFVHYNYDIRDRDAVFGLFASSRFDLIIHCAAQPSHDKAKDIPLLDFEVNAMGTVNLLEATRRYCPEAAFVHVSTNKVYGAAPNERPLIELETRWDFANAEDFEGISESCRIDQTLHSLFGASKTSADVMVQEYGRYFGLKTGIFRCGCLTGSAHSGVQLHGFLSYIVKVAVTGQTYTIFGYKGKQVRDQIHSYDVIRAFDSFSQNPRPGEVYNLGGGRQNSLSILETIDRLEQMTKRPFNFVYDEQSRVGDHICYISDLRKLRRHYPDWDITMDVDTMIEEMIEAELSRSDG